MQAEREVVDVYRCLLMQDKVGEVYEARVTGLSGSGLYAVLDDPFLDVMVRFESMGPDRYEASDDALSILGQRSGDRVSLGDRITVVIEDVALLRRTIYGRRVPPAQVVNAAGELLTRNTDEPSRRADGHRGQRRHGSDKQKPAALGRGSGGRGGATSGAPRRGNGKRGAAVGQGARSADVGSRGANRGEGSRRQRRR
jgi:ribonuclease R